MIGLIRILLQGDIDAELEVKNLSADDGIGMLISEPDKFLGRTTKVSF